MAGGTPYRGSLVAAGGFAGLRRFFAWWGRELRDLVPDGLRPLPRPPHKFIWVEFAPGSATVRRLAGGKWAELGRVDLAGTDAAARRLAFNALLGRTRQLPVALSLAAGQVLRKRLSLPLAARDNLRQVLGFELSRHTPFSADQAWFDYRELQVDAKKGSLEVELTVAARRDVEGATAMLREWGQPPLVVAAMEEVQASPRYANLLPPQLRPSLAPTVALLYGLLALTPLLLLAAALAVPIWQKSQVAEALTRQAAVARREADAVDRLRGELEAVRAEYQFPLERKYRHPAALAVLEEATRILPDGTWVSQLEIKGGEVVMSGETDTSSTLIRLFEGSDLLEEASFRSPLVKGRTNVERFQLAAKLKERRPLRPPAKAAPKPPPAGGAPR